MTPDRFSHIKFPPYQYREFPKYMGNDEAGQAVIAYTRGEEEEIRAAQAEAVRLQATLKQEQDETDNATDGVKGYLLTRARELGVKANKSWGVPKLLKAIEVAEKEDAA